MPYLQTTVAVAGLDVKDALVISYMSEWKDCLSFSIFVLLHPSILSLSCCLLEPFEVSVVTLCWLLM